jgi:hypothetical protein
VHALTEAQQVVIRRQDPALRFFLEPRAPDGGMDRLRGLPAPRCEECQPALDSVATKHAVHVEDNHPDHWHSLPGIRVIANGRPTAERLPTPEARVTGAVGSQVQRQTV